MLGAGGAKRKCGAGVELELYSRIDALTLARVLSEVGAAVDGCSKQEKYNPDDECNRDLRQRCS